MDAATRAELARLRRRAYGPAPDIDRDPDGLRRLIELEDLVRHEHVRSAGADPGGLPAADRTPDEPPTHRGMGVGHPADPDAPAGGAEHVGAAHVGAAHDGALPPGVVITQGEPADPADARPRRRTTTLAAVAAGLVVVAGAGAWTVGLAGDGGGDAGPTPTATTRPIEGREAYSFARDGEAVELLHVPLDGSFGNYIDLPSDAYVPAFPTSGVVDWAAPLGEYYGWSLWIAGAAGVVQREHCLLIERGDEQRARCVPAVLRRNAALIVSVPYVLVAPAERPIALDPNERLGFWWHDDESVTLLVGEDPPR